MSTLEKTIDVMNGLTESQLETMYDFAKFLSHELEERRKPIDPEVFDAALKNLSGCLAGRNNTKTIEDYKEERLRERYGLTS